MPWRRRFLDGVLGRAIGERFVGVAEIDRIGLPGVGLGGLIGTCIAVLLGASCFADVASGRWVIEPIPPTRLGAESSQGVSCGSSISCVAVGFFTRPRLAGIGFASAARWDGKSWSIETIPAPIGAGQDVLEGVSCASRRDCMAVGAWDSERTGNAGALAESWNGTTWSIQPVAEFAGRIVSEFVAVSCVSSTACVAVGSAGKETISGRWDGTTWSIRLIPRPAGAMSSTVGAVSCASSTACTSVGSVSYARATRPGYVSRTLAERWNGLRWSVQPTPNYKGASISGLGGVSCPSRTTCTAVGSRMLPNGKGGFASDKALAERWNGERWSVQAIPSPDGTTDSPLQGVSCASNTSCTAVGSWQRNSTTGLTVTLAEHWDGTRWEIQTTPNPMGPHLLSVLQGVSCPSSLLCMAAGQFNGVFDDEPLVERFTAHRRRGSQARG
jgi:hypothetical protein